jgi:hypothetical protein
MKRHTIIFASLIFVLGLPDLALADGHELNGSDTAWMLTATALVLFMTIPGLALFYGGLGTHQKCFVRPHAVLCTHRSLECRLGHHRL